MKIKKGNAFLFWICHGKIHFSTSRQTTDGVTVEKKAYSKITLSQIICTEDTCKAGRQGGCLIGWI